MVDALHVPIGKQADGSQLKIQWWVDFLGLTVEYYTTYLHLIA